MTSRGLLTLLALPWLLLPAGPAAATEPVEWRLAHYLPERHFFASGWLREWVESLEAASEGRLRIIVHPNNTLLRLNDIAPGVREGRAELGFGPAPSSPALSVLGLPFMADSAAHGTRIALRLLADSMLNDDLSGLHVALLQTNAPSLLHTRGTPVRRPEDLEGLRMRGATPDIRALLAALGATPVEGFLAPQVYGALRDGYVDGTIFPYEAMGVFRLAEQLDYHTEVFLFVSTLGLFINEEALAALPPDLRDVVLSHSGETQAMAAAQAWDDEEHRGRGLATAAGNTVLTVDGSALAAWRAAAERHTHARLAAIAAEGGDAEALRERIEALAVAARRDLQSSDAASNR